MKTLNYLGICLVSLLFLSAASCTPPGQKSNSEFNYDHWVPFETALTEAAESGKMVLLDVYTDWCGYCRKMNEETYSDERVQEMLDKYFHSVKLDAESNDMIEHNEVVVTQYEVARMLGVTGYPTTVFLDSDGTPVGSQPGFIDAETFANLLSFVGQRAFETQSYEDFLSELDSEG